MVYMDIPKVRGKIAEKGYTITSLAKALSIDRNTLTAYLSAPGKMPYRVLSDMAAILCTNDSEACSIFFASDLRAT